MSATPDQATVISLSRLVDRLRSLSESRLTAARPGLGGQLGGESAAAAVYQMSCWCVAAEAGVVARSADVAPTARPLPELGVFSAGDQLRVVCYDLLVALADVPGPELVWHGGVRVEADVVGAELRERLASLRAAV